MSKMKSTESAGQGEAAAGKLIDARIKELGDWRGALLSKPGMIGEGTMRVSMQSRSQNCSSTRHLGRNAAL